MSTTSSRQYLHQNNGFLLWLNHEYIYKIYETPTCRVRVTKRSAPERWTTTTADDLVCVRPDHESAARDSLSVLNNQMTRPTYIAADQKTSTMKMRSDKAQGFFYIFIAPTRLFYKRVFILLSYIVFRHKSDLYISLKLNQLL